MAFPVIHPHLHIYTLDEIQKIFSSGVPIFFDTNTFVNLWRLHTNPRGSMLAPLRDPMVRDRIFLPFQVQSELYAKAYEWRTLESLPNLANLKGSQGHIESSKKGLIVELSKVRPSYVEGALTSEEIESAIHEINQYYTQIIEWHEKQVDRIAEWLGSALDATGIKRGNAENILLEELSELFSDDRLLPQPDDVLLDEWLSEYKERVSRDDPLGPGKTDIHKSSLEQAAGDYFILKEMIRYCQNNGHNAGFIFVTDEKKADIWETPQGEKSIRRIDPRIQKEVLLETGGPMIVLSFDELLNFVVTDADNRELLTTISRDAIVETPTWSEAAFAELLNLLGSWGHDSQRDVIRAAARNGGYIPRSEIGEILGWAQGENRYLTRFRMPADRVAKKLKDSGLIPAEVDDPLVAVYDGPGVAVGYAVPAEFCAFIDGDDEESMQSGRDD